MEDLPFPAEILDRIRLYLRHPTASAYLAAIGERRRALSTLERAVYWQLLGHWKHTIYWHVDDAWVYALYVLKRSLVLQMRREGLRVNAATVWARMKEERRTWTRRE